LDAIITTPYLKCIFQLLYHTRSQEKRDIIETLLVAAPGLKRMQEAFSFWEAKLAVIKGAIKYPQGFSIEVKKYGKPMGFY
jgi:hypothetical protein